MSERLQQSIDRFCNYFYRTSRRLKRHGRFYVLSGHSYAPRRRAAWQWLDRSAGDLRDLWDARKQLSSLQLAASAAAGCLVIAAAIVGVASIGSTAPTSSKTQRPTNNAPAAAPEVAHQISQTASTAPPASKQPPAAAASAPPPASQPLLFGMGAQMDGAMKQRLYREAPVNLLTSWYNSPSDLRFMLGWKNTAVPTAYANGKSLHLIVWTGDDERQLNTKYGPACGRGYPLSAGFAEDMKQLATTFKGNGALYVSMFTEFQTYPCRDNIWAGSENYYRALQDQYRLAQTIFKQHAPNAQLSLTWGGWQSRWDDRTNGGGKSLIPHFADVMHASDFQSFQAMDSSNNADDITNMTRLLHAYGSKNGKGGNKVMVAHYKPDNSNQATWQADLNRVFTPTNVARLKQDGLFAFSFMDEKNINASEASYQQARGIIQTYGR